MTTLSLRAILGSAYTEFLEKFIADPIEKAFDDGKLTADDVERISKKLNKSGNNLFDVPAQELKIPSRIQQKGGTFYRVSLEVTPNYTVDLFVKQYGSKEDYERAKKTQTSLKQKQLDDILLTPEFSNDTHKLLAYTFIDQIDLTKTLTSASMQEKEELLKKIILKYQTAFKNLKGVETQLAWNYDKHFERFFTARMGDSAKPLAKRFSEEFGSYYVDTPDIVHMDLHLGNVILHGSKNPSEAKVTIIDNDEYYQGFQETDIAKLLTKAGINRETEERIVDFAGKGKKKYKNRYYVERFNRELWNAVRYIQRSSELQSEEFKSKANASYNLAVRRLDDLIQKGLATDKLRSELVNYMETHESNAFSLLSDLELENILYSHDPHESLSIDDFEKTKLKLSGSDDQRQKGKKAIKKLRRSLRKHKKRSRLTKLGASTAFVAAITAGIYSANLDSKLEKTQENLAKKEKDIEYTYRKLKQSRLTGILKTTANTMDGLPLKRMLEYYEKRFGDKKLAVAFQLEPAITRYAMLKVGYNPLKDKGPCPNPKEVMWHLYKSEEFYILPLEVDNVLNPHVDRFMTFIYDTDKEKESQLRTVIEEADKQIRRDSLNFQLGFRTRRSIEEDLRSGKTDRFWRYKEVIRRR